MYICFSIVFIIIINIGVSIHVTGLKLNDVRRKATAQELHAFFPTYCYLLDGSFASEIITKNKNKSLNMRAHNAQN